MKSYIHLKDNNKKNILIYGICLLFLIIYGLYKNGLLLYLNGYGTLLDIGKFILLIIISLVINILVELIYYKKIKLNYSYIEVLIIAMFMPCSVNLILYSILLFMGLLGGNYLENKFDINKIALIKLLIVVGLIIIDRYNYMNKAEASSIYAYNLFDVFWGRNTSGFATSSILIGVIVYIVLAIFTNYKKIIPIVSYLSYVVISILIMLIAKDINWENIISSTVILSLILVASNNLSSPYRQDAQICYAFFIGVFGAIFTYFLPYEGIFISILLISLLNKIINRLFRRLNNVKKA